MKFSAQEEYGLRCLLQIARAQDDKPVTILEISDAEGLTATNVAKILHLLRNHGFIESLRGQSGGYVLAGPANSIKVIDVLIALGGTLYDDGFCEKHSGTKLICAHDVGCSVRTLWQKVQAAVDDAIGDMTLADLNSSEDSTMHKLTTLDKYHLRGTVQS